MDIGFISSAIKIRCHHFIRNVSPIPPLRYVFDHLNIQITQGSFPASPYTQPKASEPYVHEKQGTGPCLYSL